MQPAGNRPLRPDPGSPTSRTGAVVWRNERQRPLDGHQGRQRNGVEMRLHRERVHRYSGRARTMPCVAETFGTAKQAGRALFLAELMPKVSRNARCGPPRVVLVAFQPRVGNDAPRPLLHAGFVDFAWALRNARPSREREAPGIRHATHSAVRRGRAAPVYRNVRRPSCSTSCSLPPRLASSSSASPTCGAATGCRCADEPRYRDRNRPLPLALRVPRLRAAPPRALLEAPVTVNGWLQIGFFALLSSLTKPVGLWLYRVFESERGPCRACSGRWSGSSSASAAWTRRRSRTGRRTRPRCWSSAHGRARHLRHPAAAGGASLEPARHRRRRRRRWPSTPPSASRPTPTGSATPASRP